MILKCIDLVFKVSISLNLHKAFEYLGQIKFNKVFSP